MSGCLQTTSLEKMVGRVVVKTLDATPSVNEEVEFKENFGNLNSINRVICSFANTGGGVLSIVSPPTEKSPIPPN